MNVRSLVFSLVLSAFSTQSDAMKILVGSLEDLNSLTNTKLLPLEISCPIQGLTISFPLSSFMQTITYGQTANLNLASEENLSEMSLRNFIIWDDASYDALLVEPQNLRALTLQNVQGAQISQSRNFLSHLNNLTSLSMEFINLPSLLKKTHPIPNLTNLNILNIYNQNFDLRLECNPPFLSPNLKVLNLQNVAFKSDAAKSWITDNTTLEELTLNTITGNFGTLNDVREIFKLTNLKRLKLVNAISDNVPEKIIENGLKQLTNLHAITLGNNDAVRLVNIGYYISMMNNLRRENNQPLINFLNTYV